MNIFTRFIALVGLLIGSSSVAAHSDNTYSQAIAMCHDWIASDTAFQESYGNPVTSSWCTDIPGDWFASGYIGAFVVIRNGAQTDNIGFDWYFDDRSPIDVGQNLGAGAGCDGGEGSTTDGNSDCGRIRGAPDVGIPTAGDPINTATGNKYFQEDDYAVSDWLRFRRFYNSASSETASSIGNGWSHSFNRSLTRSDTSDGSSSLIARRPNGVLETFHRSSASAWATTPNNPDTLTEAIDAEGTTTGYSLHVAVLQHTEKYGADGTLLSIQDAAGQAALLSYSNAQTDLAIAPRPGLLIKVTAPDGRSLSFIYDAEARISSLTLPDGGILHYAYDSASNLISARQPDATTRHYAYNEQSLTSGTNLPSSMTGLIDENENRYEDTTYDTSGRAISTQRAGGADRVAVTYYAGGTSDVTFPLGNTSRQTYTTVQGLLRVGTIDKPCGECAQRYASRVYDANSRPSGYTDFNGNVYATTYDSNGLLTKEIDAKGTSDQRTITTIWNAALREPVSRTLTNATGEVVSKEGWSYNESGKTTASCLMDPAKASTYTCTDAGTGHAGVRRSVMTYCTAVDNTACPLVGLLLKVDGPRTDVTDTLSYAYYLTTDESGCATAGGSCHRAGDLLSITDGTGLVTTYVTYDKAGRPTRVKAPTGVLTDFSYTPRGWLASKTVRASASGAGSSSDAVTAVAYDPTGTVHSVTDADGVSTVYGYDPAHRLTDITDGSGNRIHYTLDAGGNRTSEQILTSNGTVVRSLGRTFNQLGQLTALTDGLNRTVLNAGFSDSYDGNGNLIHAADGLGIQSKNILDGLDRLTSAIRNYQGADPSTANAQSVTSFDALDRTTGFSDPDGLNTTYDHDAFGNVTALNSPDTGATARSYDITGNLTAATDATNVSHTSTFDADSRLLKTTYADTNANSQFKYDEADSATGCTGNYSRGHATRVVESNGGIVWCYDGRGNVVRKQQTVGTATRTTTYTWTLANRLKSVMTPNGTLVAYARNSLGQIISVQATPSGAAATTVVSGAAYQPFGPITSYKLGDGQTVSLTYDLTGALTDITSTAFSLHVKRDVMGNITALGDAAGVQTPSETYGYDALYRLTGVKAPDGTAIEAYTYNKTGDRLSKIAPGLLTGSYTYAAGTHHLTGVGTTARQVDARGDTTANVLASGVYGFGYNARNRLTVVQNNGATVGSYVLNALGERVQKTAGSVSTRFDYDEDSRLISESAGTGSRDYVWMGDLPVGVVDRSGASAAVNFVHTDGMGTPRAVTNAGGAVLWQWAYASNAFGEKAPTSASGYVLNLRFPGQYFDAESVLAYNVNREYEAASGRYIQSDPVGLSGGVSTYGYVASKPLRNSDRFGLKYAEAYGASGAVIGGVVGFVCGSAATVGTAGINAPLLPAETYGFSAAGAAVGYGLGWVADGIMGSHGQESSKSNPIQGTPGDTSWTSFPDGSPKQGRTYGDDGYPQTDVDYGHDHNGAGDPHVHDWDRPADGSRPENSNRGPARPPTPDEVNRTP